MQGGRFDSKRYKSASQAVAGGTASPAAAYAALDWHGSLVCAWVPDLPEVLGGCRLLVSWV